MEPAVLPQYIAAFSACLGAMATGAILGYSSPAGPLLVSGSDPQIQLTEQQNGIFASLVAVGAIAGGPIAAFCMKRFGRKPTMLFSAVPFLLGWGLIAGAPNFAVLLIGRIITGICCGISAIVVNTYIGEFSSANIRGTLGSGFQLMVVTGILYAYCMAPFLSSFRMIAIICAIPSALYCVAVFFCKESPSYLLQVNKEEEAIEALQYFRGPEYDISKEIEALKIAIEEDRRNKKGLKDIGTPYILRPFLIGVGLMFFQQFSGINAVLFNLSAIFSSVGSPISNQVAPIIIASAQVISTFFAGLIIEKLGRKLLLVISGFVMAISLVALGVYFYELEVAPDVAKNITWLPLASLSVFIIFFSLGFGPVPWIVMSEVFTSDIREVAASMVTMSNWICAFAVTALYNPLSGAIHSYGVYWLFAGFCAISIIFCQVFLIETKGKTIQEITILFGGPVGARNAEKETRSDSPATAAPSSA